MSGGCFLCFCKMKNFDFSPRVLLIVDVMLQSMKYGRGSHSAAIEALCYGKRRVADIEECQQAESLLFALGLVQGSPACYFLTQDGLRAQKIGVAAFLKKKKRKERRELVSYILVWITAICTVATLLI